jgi:DNA-binding transcriptional ArsR family regulator
MKVMDAFAVIAEPNRRHILEQLRASERSVAELVDALDMAQPTVSKHLKVLRDEGFVSSRIAAQRRIYQLQPERLRDVYAWLEPYVDLWNRHLDALERHLHQRDRK